MSDSFDTESLSAAAVELNAASDELAQTIDRIDAVLKSLGLGISVWSDRVVVFAPDGTAVEASIGYAKPVGKWGLALLNHGIEAQWAFNDAPRWLRIVMVDYIPPLLLRIEREARKLTAVLHAKSTAVAAWGLPTATSR